MEKPATPLYQNGGSPVRTSVLGKEEGDCGCGAFPALTQTGEAKRSRLLLTQRRWRDSLACFAGKSVRENAALCCAKHRGIRQCAHCRMNMPPACSIHIRISPLSKITQPPRWGGCVIFGGDGGWRDSNSRGAFDPYTISNRARSTNYATSPYCSRIKPIHLSACIL